MVRPSPVVAAIIFAVRRQAEPELARSGPVVAYQIDQDTDLANPEVLHARWPAVKRLSLADPVRADVLAALHDARNFRNGSVKCFTPGMGFRVGTGRDAVDALVCLKCDNVYFYRVGDEMAYKSSRLTPSGHAAFLQAYRQLFDDPGNIATTKPGSS